MNLPPRLVAEAAAFAIAGTAVLVLGLTVVDTIASRIKGGRS